VQTFQVTHPFHPWKGREFSLVTYRTNWGEDRVYFHDEQGRLISLPARWTNVLPPEPLVVMAEGRSAFRVDDLLQLVALIHQLDSQAAKGGTVDGVKQTTPRM
jgi:hypothetical protein